MVDGRVGRQLPPERDLPRVDREPYPAGALVGAPGASPAVEHDLGEPVGGGRGGALEQRCSGEARDERIGRGGDELRRRPALQDPAVHDHADVVGERGGVLEVVGDENRRQRELPEQLVELDPHRRLGVRVERRERLVEQQDARLEGERPRERDPLALATRQLADAGRSEMGDSEPFEQVGHRRSATGAEADVREHVEVGEERVLLEEVSHPATLGRHVDASLGVEPGPIAERDDAGPRPQQPGDHPQHRRLPGSRRADEGRRGAVRDGQLDGRVEATKGMGEVDAERHRVRSLTERRVTALMITRTALIASATLKSRSNCS